MANPVVFTIRPTLTVLHQQLKARLDRVSDLQPAYKKASIFLDRWVQKNFQTEGGNVGNWKPFSEFNSRKLRDPSAKLLQDTRALQKSFIPFATKKDAGIGSELPYSEDHQYGDPSRNLPARRMLPYKKEVIPDVKEIMKAHVKDALK